MCGNQSSEKSFMLKAISGVSFSVKNNLSIQFLTELVFHKMSQVDVSMSIVSH